MPVVIQNEGSCDNTNTGGFLKSSIKKYKQQGIITRASKEFISEMDRLNEGVIVHNNIEAIGNRRMSIDSVILILLEAIKFFNKILKRINSIVIKA